MLQPSSSLPLELHDGDGRFAQKAPSREDAIAVASMAQDLNGEGRADRC